ncbi:MAG: response regulator transcription factor [Clostridia bacterium]|nr:response regulator transcription factor [Clostridia bacterium]
MYTVLIADDEAKIRAVIREYAEFEGYKVVEAVDGADAVEKCKTANFDAVIMDIMMPVLDGFSATKMIKKEKDIPVIMLSARGEEYDKLFGFEIGIDDYVVKPFSPKELMARINVVISRHKSSVVIHNTLKIAGLEIDFDAHSVYVNKNKIDLTPKEFELLAFLANNRNIALSRDKILNSVWGFDFFGDGRTVDTHIKMLRNNLGSCRDLIVTVRGIGYKFEYEEGRDNA